MFRRGTTSAASATTFGTTSSRCATGHILLRGGATTAVSTITLKPAMTLVSTTRGLNQQLVHYTRSPVVMQATKPMIWTSASFNTTTLINMRVPVTRMGFNAMVPRTFSTLLLNSARNHVGKSATKTVAKSAAAGTSSALATTRNAVGGRAYATIQAEAPSREFNTFYVVLGSMALAGIGYLVINGLRHNINAITASDQFTQAVAQRLQQTYGYVAGGIALTAATASYLFLNGTAIRMISMSPWKLLGLSVVGTIGSMLAVQLIPPEQTVARHLAFALFNATMGASLAPIGFMGGRLVMNAMAGTGIIVGVLSLLAASSPGTFMGYEGPLGLGLGVLLAASVGQMFWPSALLYNVCVYGGLALFGGFMLSDTQRVITAAQTSPVFDPMVASISIYLNIINIFVRIVSILGDRQQRRS